MIKNDQASDDDFLEHADVDGILIMMHPFGESLMSKMPNLKVVARHGVGYDNVDLDAASAHDIVVKHAWSECNCGRRNGYDAYIDGWTTVLSASSSYY